jgi:hypothetical protein
MKALGRFPGAFVYPMSTELSARVIKAVARSSVDLMRNHAIIDAGVLMSQPGTACALLNEAWSRFLADPRAYPEWEGDNLPP